MISLIIYIYAGITYSVMLLLLDDISIELNETAKKLGKDLDPLRVDLKGCPALIVIVIAFWPLMAAPTIYKRLTDKG